MRFGLRAEAVDDVEKVKTGLIKSRRLIFTPSVGLKQELANTSISITCIDRNGKVVKNVTSGDKNDVEDPDNTENTGSGTQGGNTDKDNTGSQGSGSQGSGSSTGSGDDNTENME